MPGPDPSLIFPVAVPIPAAAPWTARTGIWQGNISPEPVPPYVNNAADTPDGFWDVPNAVTLTANAFYQIPHGEGHIVTGAVVNGCALQMNMSGVWTTIKTLNVNDSYRYDSDYGNVALQNGSAGTTTVTLVPIRTR
jgi:hypothetical protein